MEYITRISEHKAAGFKTEHLMKCKPSILTLCIDVAE